MERPRAVAEMNSPVFPEDLLQALDRKYARFGCLFFAAAVSRETGLPVGIMDAPAAGTLGHAFLILEAHPDREKSITGDAVCTTTVADVRRDYRDTHGPLRWRADETLPERDPATTEPEVAMVAIARRLPWLAPYMGAEAPGPAEFEEVGQLLAAIRAARRGSEPTDWGAVEALADSLNCNAASVARPR